MQNLWKLQSKVDFIEVSNNLFVVESRDVLNLKKIQDDHPWSFDRNLLCLTKCDQRLILQQVVFKKEPMWVQAHDLPLDMMNQTYGRLLRHLIGEVEDIDVDKDGLG